MLRRRPLHLHATVAFRPGNQGPPLYAAVDCCPGNTQAPCRLAQADPLRTVTQDDITVTIIHDATLMVMGDVMAVAPATAQLPCYGASEARTAPRRCQDTDTC